jgi:hypothetical protein
MQAYVLNAAACSGWESWGAKLGVFGRREPAQADRRDPGPIRAVQGRASGIGVS